jgi:type I site-specific restriction endonuclease
MKNKRLTTKVIIDNHLNQSGWKVTDRTHEVEEYDIQLGVFEDPAGPYPERQYSDYVLLGKDGKHMAVFEQKKIRRTLHLGETTPNNTAAISNKHKTLICLFAHTPTDTIFNFEMYDSICSKVFIVKLMANKKKTNDKKR